MFTVLHKCLREWKLLFIMGICRFLHTIFFCYTYILFTIFARWWLLLFLDLILLLNYHWGSIYMLSQVHLGIVGESSPSPFWYKLHQLSNLLLPILNRSSLVPLGGFDVVHSVIRSTHKLQHQLFKIFFGRNELIMLHALYGNGGGGPCSSFPGDFVVFLFLGHPKKS